jgi:hypothetical protein
VDRNLKLPWMKTKSEEIESYTIVEKRVTMLIDAQPWSPISHPTSHGKGESTSKRLRTNMTQIWMTIT